MRSRAILAGSRAFTLPELLITLGLLGLVVAIAVPVVSNLQVSSQLDDVTTEIKMALRTVRTRSEARVGNATHGMLFTLTPGAQSYTLYQVPDGASARDTALDEVRQIPPSMTISTTISGGDINFSRGSGAPNISTAQSITITHAAGGVRTITITPAGLVDAE
ncbi:MAG: prepilin-type N-terminal cleavage/methylation domain-containing protein [Patescibacteria group bacterium]